MSLDEKIKLLDQLKRTVSDLYEYTKKLKSDNQKRICEHMYSDFTDRIWKLEKALEKENKDSEFNGWLEKQRKDDELKAEYSRGFAHGRYYG